MRRQLAAARQYFVEVAIEKPVVPHRFEQQVQKKPEILDIDDTADARVEQCVESVLESCEQLADDLVLVAEMIVEVSRADTHLVGDIRGGDVRFAQTVEHHQAGFDDPLARASRTFALRHDDRSRTSELAH